MSYYCSMGWYDSIKKQKVTILPYVINKMENIGWLDPLVEKLKTIKSVDKSGIYRVSLGDDYGGRDFNVKIMASTGEIQIVDVVPVELEVPLKLLD